MEPHEEDEVEDAEEFEEVFTVEDLIVEDDIFEEIVAEGFKADMDREASKHRLYIADVDRVDQGVIPPEVRTNDDPNPSFAEALRRNSAIKARPTHRQLKKDLIEHIWQRYGNKEN
ncbi:hypothetical protein OsJ_01811 [Oryza sativa Japonica Group]|uniref:Uncharacterized protein n=1 Tax=Oryza sativa subsp. japonica TaxID=39947 RepID=B9EWT9_ORYSJ|nr:hypothetical protein OsJ_01811 [Oryza sativa Japonica Group]